ncbi:Stp1/IreP family PP2C-type Ser/Thr phosphatase [Lacticaseibacillus nasuensis]|uniref:Stp1/IreP family PP2C-type Ser/Thr phosphatase n=1 Tax=Lacticaseibacillus nasuensis TaxID=944671 RepID=UPI002245CDD7|nr:Stp1/IreP family PP2C-type Ser/Thr phosphatase [Lacticaseibacillus nasuensis]MCX2455977.1 Stp1/IreP family PP2C-type Ser/Thr phosphatase [Lacticaseibacillus nasuensis]
MEFAYRTDIGQKRPNNEDYVGLFTNRGQAMLAIVADGMGGHQGGDVASEMAVSHIGYAFENTTAADISELVRWLVFELQQENSLILEKANQYADLSGMGTTLVAVIISGNRFVVANIGDSRGYLYRGGHLVQITEDHSLVNELVKSGELTPAQARKFPRRNVITRSLGVADSVDADVTIYDMEYQDYLLLCSDGLTNQVSDDQLANILASGIPIGTMAGQMVAAANAAGGPDNITALIIHQDWRGQA